MLYWDLARNNHGQMVTIQEIQNTCKSVQLTIVNS